MHENAENPLGTEPAKRMQSETRFLIDDPVMGWRLFPLTRALVAYQGDLALPEYAGRSLRIAFAHVELAGDGPLKLKRLECSEWHLDAEGRVDQDKLMRGIVERINPVEGAIDYRLLASVPVTDEDIMAIQRCLGVQ